MKKLLSIFLPVLIVSNICACSYLPKNNDDALIENTTQAENEKEMITEEIETIARSNNYHLYRVVGTFELGCDIYNSNGEVVFSEKTQRSLNVSEIDPDLIEISIGYGTGIIGHRYFNVKTNQMSEEYFYVIANFGTQIAYLDGGINDRKLIVQDIYRSIDDCQSFELDFSPDHTPVIDAEFSEDGSTLCVTYCEGESYATSQATLKLS